MRCYKEEIFGPVLLAMTSDTLEEVTCDYRLEESLLNVEVGWGQVKVGKDC
jgi:hypothetical protein